MPTASARGRTLSRAWASPATAVAAPTATAPFSRSRREWRLVLLLSLALLGVLRELLRRDVARADHGADDEAGHADGRGRHAAVIGVHRRVGAGRRRAVHVHRVVERDAEADLLLGAAEAGVAD